MLQGKEYGLKPLRIEKRRKKKKNRVDRFSNSQNNREISGWKPKVNKRENEKTKDKTTKNNIRKGKRKKTNEKQIKREEKDRVNLSTNSINSGKKRRLYPQFSIFKGRYVTNRHTVSKSI